MVVMLDRERHHDAMAEVRDAGARVRLILDGDVSAALLAVSDNSPVDLLWGIGGTPEGVITAAAIKCIGGRAQGPAVAAQRRRAGGRSRPGYDLERCSSCDDLVAGEDVFFSATGVTDGDVLQGVRYQGDRGATTESLVMRVAIGDRAARLGASRPRQAAHGQRRPLRLSGPLGLDVLRGGRAGSAKRPTLDSARSSVASERRNACVTSTWIADWVASYTGVLKPAAIAG